MALGRILGEHLLQERPESCRDRRVGLAHVRRRRHEVLEDAFAEPAVREWRFAGQHVIGRAAERVNIASDVRGTAVARLFRRHVVDGADGAAFARDLEIAVLFPPRQAEIGELDDEVLIHLGQQDVGGLDIAVHDAVRKCMIQRLDDLEQNAAGFLGLELASIPDVIEQVDAVNELHRQVVQAVIRVEAAFEEGNNIGMAQAGHVAGFPVQPLQERGGLGNVFRQHLEGDRAAQLDVHGLVDRAHAARGDVGKHLIFAEARAGFNRA